MNDEVLDDYFSSLRNSSSSIRIRDIEALFNASLNSSNSIQMINKGFVTPFLSILRADASGKVKTSVLGLLCNLSTQNAAHEELCTEDSLSLLTSFLTRSNSNKILRRVIGILSNLMIDDELKTRIGSADVLTILVDCLSSQDEKLKNNAACILWKLTANHYFNQATLIEHKLHEKLPTIQHDNCSYYLRGLKRSCAIFIHENDIAIKEKLATTRLNTVFRGIWKEREVATKSYIGSSLPETIAQETLAEALILKELSHTNIIKLYGMIPKHNVPAILVMEYASRGSLYRYLHSSMSITWSVRLKIALDLSQGLLYIHSQKIVHGDIKSLNILLDQNNVPKWCDFGFSQLRKHAINSSEILLQQPATTQAPGTLRWMAPELLERQQSFPGRKADIWALGMVFFELASRLLPFSDMHDILMIKNAITQSNGENIPRDCEQRYPVFAAIMQQCWKKEPRQRPAMEQIVTTLSQAYSA